MVITYSTSYKKAIRWSLAKSETRWKSPRSVYGVLIALLERHEILIDYLGAALREEDLAEFWQIFRFRHRTSTLVLTFFDNSMVSKLDVQ